VGRIYTDELDEHAGHRVRLLGWLHRFRELGGVGFAVLRDARGIAQIVVRSRSDREDLERLPLESAIEVEAEVREHEQAPGGFELVEPRIETVAAALDPPPFDLFRPVIRAQLPTILDHAALSLRHPVRRAALTLSAASVAGFRACLRSQGFTEVFTPKTVGTSTESGANVFELDYFGRPAYLAQSPQLYKQLLVGVFERVFEVGPVFRAEPHDTTRHLSEYVSLDAEMGFVGDESDVITVLRSSIASMTAFAAEEGEAVELAGAQLPDVPDGFPVLHFADAQALVSDATGEDLSEELDLAPTHERWLCEWAVREHGSEFLIVTGFPLAKRPFYTHPDPSRPGFTRGFDLLFRGLEIVTGGQRLHRYEDYVAALTSRGETVEGLEWYLEAFRHGMPPHGGFAIGLERWVAQLIGAANVRDVRAFPRDVTRLKP
jgi:nondiscriminating aspartyl-tRNA synthetase